MTEDSEPGPDAPGPVLEELVAQRGAAPAAGHFVSHAGAALLRLRLQLLGQAVGVNWALKCGPWCVVLILLGAKYYYCCNLAAALKK